MGKEMEQEEEVKEEIEKEEMGGDGDEGGREIERRCGEMGWRRTWKRKRG